MNPLTRLFRRSRVFRVFFYLSMVPLWYLVSMVAANSLSGYTQTGSTLLVAAMMFFGLWAWWYGEDRDRRRGARAAAQNGDPKRDGDGG